MAMVSVFEIGLIIGGMLTEIICDVHWPALLNAGVGRKTFLIELETAGGLI